MARSWGLGIRFLISLGCIALLLWWLVDPRQAWQAISGARWDYLTLTALWLFLDRVVMAYKWRLLLLCRGVPVGFGESVSSYLLATFAGYFLPSTVGADAMRIAVLSRPGRPSEMVAASVVMERSLGFLAAALAGLVSLVLLVGLAASLPGRVLAWAVGLLLLVAVGMGVSLYGPLGRWLEGLPARLENRGRLVRWLGRFLAAYTLYRRHPGTLAYFTFLSFLEQIAPVVAVWLAGLAMHMQISFLQSLAVVPVANLFARVPIAISTLGVVESLYVAFFALVGVNATSAFMVGLVMSLAVMVTSLPGALVYLVTMRRPGGGEGGAS